MGRLFTWGHHTLGMRLATVGGLTLASLLCATIFTANPTVADNERVITIYHDGTEQTVVTDATTVKAALERGGVVLNKDDLVEPSGDTVLEAPSYSVNVYRARPVTVVDGANRYEIMSAHTSARQLAADAGLTLQAEDEYTLARIDDFLSDDGIGLKLTIKRATPMVLVLYGKTENIYTQAKDVDGLMKEKGIVLAAQDGTNLPGNTPVTAGLELQIWRNGVSTITEEEPVQFPIEQTRDGDKPVGYRQVTEAGVLGKKLVTYQIELRDGKEVSRTTIQSVVTSQPQKQIEVIGAKPSGNGLTKSKGVYFNTDSQGVTHRETFYDLNMGGTMKYCGGSYSIRADGVKVDQNGYVLVAANLSRYPRCSIVETSLGPGKVYDTGAFVSTYPDGFDLATDWSNGDGR